MDCKWFVDGFGGLGDKFPRSALDQSWDRFDYLIRLRQSPSAVSETESPNLNKILINRFETQAGHQLCVRRQPSGVTDADAIQLSTNLNSAPERLVKKWRKPIDQYGQLIIQRGNLIYGLECLAVWNSNYRWVDLHFPDVSVAMGCACNKLHLGMNGSEVWLKWTKYV